MQDSITRERWRTIEPLLDGVLGIAPEARAAWLAERCSGDAELREAVERLAAAYADAQRVLPSGRPDAVEALRDVFEVSRRQWGVDNPRTQRDARELVKLYQAWGKPDSAEAYRRYLR